MVECIILSKVKLLVWILRESSISCIEIKDYCNYVPERIHIVMHHLHLTTKKKTPMKNDYMLLLYSFYQKRYVHND